MTNKKLTSIFGTDISWFTEDESTEKIKQQQLNFELLRKQKQALISTINKADEEDTKQLLDGLLSMIDNIQDRAADIFGEAIVFGKTKSEENE